MDKQRVINLFAAISTITVFGFALGLMFPLLALIMEKRGIDPDIIGYNTAMQPLGIMLSVFTTPILVRKFGAKRATIGAALATGTVILFYPFLSVFWWWFALRILHGFFVSTLFAISEAWIVKFAEGPYRSRILALYTSVLAASFGGGPALISFTGIDTALPFVIGAAVLAIATIPIFFVKDETIDGDDEDPISVIGFIRKAPILLIAVGMFAIIDAANLSFLPVYGVKKGLDQATASLALTAFIVGNTVLQFPIGWLADHFKKRWVMAGCGVVTACASALLPLSFEYLGVLALAHRRRSCFGGYLHCFSGRTGRALLRPRTGDGHSLLLHYLGTWSTRWFAHRRLVHAKLWSRRTALFHGPDICPIPPCHGGTRI